MKIDATEYGSITANGASYPYDILICLSREEAEFIFEIEGVLPKFNT